METKKNKSVEMRSHLVLPKIDSERSYDSLIRSQDNIPKGEFGYLPAETPTETLDVKEYRTKENPNHSLMDLFLDEIASYPKLDLEEQIKRSRERSMSKRVYRAKRPEDFEDTRKLEYIAKYTSEHSCEILDDIAKKAANLPKHDPHYSERLNTIYNRVRDLKAATAPQGFVLFEDVANQIKESGKKGIIYGENALIEPADTDEFISVYFGFEEKDIISPRDGFDLIPVIQNPDGDPTHSIMQAREIAKDSEGHLKRFIANDALSLSLIETKLKEDSTIVSVNDRFKVMPKEDFIEMLEEQGDKFNKYLKEKHKEYREGVRLFI